LQEIATAAGVATDDRSMLGVAAVIERQREALARLQQKAGNAGDGISFSRDVAPIIADACLGCHGAENPRANLRLDTFAGWKRGGRSGPLLVVGNADNSLIMRALRATDPERRMPKGGDALPDERLKTIADWINGGAKFDGRAEDTTLADLIANAPLDSSVVIPKPKGTETVSFTRDIAPFMANLCGGCHSRTNRNGGLCLETFYDMLKGGDSGVVVIPGDGENSRLFRLTGGLENPRMPQGDTRITRKNYNDLKQWFAEGCVYDGEDPRKPLRDFVRSVADIEAEKFAAMTADEFHALRQERTSKQFKDALPNDTAQTLDTDEFLLIGNVPVERLQQVADWSANHTEKLRKLFSERNDHLWKGRLAVFVFKDRFSYDEFNLVIEKREAPAELTGHSKVAPTFEEAYIALLDVGDEPRDEAPTLHINLVDHLTGAFLKRDGGGVPVWVQRGLGLSLAAQTEPGNPYLRRLPAQAKQHVGALSKPSDIFVDGTFSPGVLGPVAYSLVDYMLDVGGTQRFARFAGELSSGKDAAAALRAVYDSDPDTLARSYVRSLK
jgi:mono/diheme cytochrome c family protein